MVLTHQQQQQQQHLSHLDRVGIVFQKYRVRFQKPQEWQNPRGNPNRIKYQSYTGVWVNYTVKNPKKSWFWWTGLEQAVIYILLTLLSRLGCKIRGLLTQLGEFVAVRPHLSRVSGQPQRRHAKPVVQSNGRLFGHFDPRAVQL